MVKHKTPSFKQLEGSTSTSTTRAVPRNQSTSVKERLQELRQAEPAEAAARRQALADSAAQPSIPPDVQRILGFERTRPPPGRARTRWRDRLRIAGPAPPSSWLRGDVSGEGSPSGTTSRNGPKWRDGQLVALNRFKGLYSAEEQTLSLTAMVLRRLAISWHSLDTAEKGLLIACPQRIRVDLLPHLAHHGAHVTAADFAMLIDGAEPVTELDLGGLVARSDLTLPVLTTHIKAAKRTVDQNQLLDDWESSDRVPVPTPMSARFQSLTHLCLSHPPSTILWRDLLALTAHTPQLTHLSLAYWPQPTLTPNLLTATVTDRRGQQVSAGGSSFYSEVSTDLDEPLVLFRKLSANLLLLQFLDIEGNHNWLPALAIGSAGPPCRVSAELMLTTWRKLDTIHCEEMPKEFIDRLESNFGSGRNGRRLKHSAQDAFTEMLNRHAVDTEEVLLRASYESWELAYWASRFIAASRRSFGASPISFGLDRRSGSTSFRVPLR